MANDRIYTKVDRRLLARLQELADDPARPFFAEGRPHAPIHGRLLTEMPETPDVKARFKDLTSFRAEGKPQCRSARRRGAAARPAHTFAEMDLDLEISLRIWLASSLVGELLDGNPTNHLVQRKALAKSTAKDLLYLLNCLRPVNVTRVA